MELEGAANAPRRPLKPLQARSAKTQYLILYNFVSTLLWLIVLGRVVALNALASHAQVFASTGDFVKWTQTLAGLEVVHTCLGIVRSSVFTTAIQVASRFLLVWGVVNVFPELAVSPVYSSMLVAWSVTEVIRYSYFTLSLSGLLPGFLNWLRYNTFFVLYPLGISSECWLVYKAMVPASQIGQVWVWALLAILGIYVPGSYILYTHMIAQRRKVLRGKQRKE